MMVNQHPKKTVSLKKKRRLTLTIVMAQVVVALMGKVLVAAATPQMQMVMRKTLMGKSMNPAMRLKSQMLKMAPVLQNLMMKF